MNNDPERIDLWDTLGLEAAELLADLVRIDTTNPPGNETPAAEHIAGYLRARGIEGELLGAQADRLSYVARIDGDRPGPTLLLLSHTDVVPAEEAEWTVPPFGGEVRDGYVWGRGTLDMKNMLAAQALAMSRLAESNAGFTGSVILCAVADEEVGNYGGIGWLIANHPELVRCDYVLNEGGGEFVEIDGRRTQLLTVGEKGTAQFRLTFSGDAGHASAPLTERNAVANLARAIVALNDYQPLVHLETVPTALLERCVGDEALLARLADPVAAREALDELSVAAPDIAGLVLPLYGLTFAPTIVHAGGEAVNVYPSHGEVRVDCRTLPGQSAEEVRSEIEAALAGLDDWELEWISVIPGNASPYETTFTDAIATVVEEMTPGTALAPMHCVGYTDSNSFRCAWPEVIAYGFLPFVTEDYFTVKERFHNKDERIAVRDLGFQAAFIERLIRVLLA